MRGNKKDDLLVDAWVVIANASFGDWTKESKEWQKAAARWRDDYFAQIGRRGFFGRIFRSLRGNGD
jgi:hypothetical protein